MYDQENKVALQRDLLSKHVENRSQVTPSIDICQVSKVDVQLSDIKYHQLYVFLSMQHEEKLSKLSRFSA